jgi:hypothetical protein
MGHSLTSTLLVLQIIRSVTTERDVKCVHQLAEVRDQISFHPDITDTMNTLYGEELSSSADKNYLSNAMPSFLCRPQYVSMRDFWVHRYSKEPGSSVSIVSGYGLEDRAIEVRSPAETKEFLL